MLVCLQWYQTVLRKAPEKGENGLPGNDEDAFVSVETMGYCGVYIHTWEIDFKLFSFPEVNMVREEWLGSFGHEVCQYSD